MKHHHVAASGLDAVENVSQVIEIKMIADRNEDVTGTHTQRLGAELSFELEIELVHLYMRHAAVPGAVLGNGEHEVQKDGKNPTRDRGNRLGKEVGDRDRKQRQCDQPETHRDLHAAYGEVQRNLELAFPGRL